MHKPMRSRESILMLGLVAVVALFPFPGNGGEEQPPSSGDDDPLTLRFCHGGPDGKIRVGVLIGREIPPFRKALKGFKRGFTCSSTCWLEPDRDSALGSLPGMKQPMLVDDDLAGSLCSKRAELAASSLGLAIRRSRKLPLADILDEIKKAKPRLVHAIGSSALRVLDHKLPDLPGVFSMVVFPGSRRGNISGVELMTPDRIQLQALKAMVPTLKSLGMVYNPQDSGASIEEMKKAAESMGIGVLAVPVSAKKEVEAAFTLLVGKVEAFWLPMDKTVVASFALIKALADKNRIPLAAFSYKYVEFGALLSVVPRFDSIGEKAGSLAAELLQGGPGRTVRLDRPEELRYTINTETAKNLGLTVPDSFPKQSIELFDGLPKTRDEESATDLELPGRWQIR